MIETFTALAEPNRYRIVEFLRAGAAPVGRVSQELGIRQPQASKHLQVLKEAGLVTVQPVAQQRLYQLSPARFQELDAWLASYRALWVERFAELDEVIAELKHRHQKESST